MTIRLGSLFRPGTRDRVTDSYPVWLFNAAVVLGFILTR